MIFRESLKTLAALATLAAALANVYIIIKVHDDVGEVQADVTEVRDDVTAVKDDVQVVHLSVNSRLDELVRQTKLAAHAAGVVEGRADLKQENEQERRDEK